MRDRKLGPITVKRRRFIVGEKGLETGSGAQSSGTADGGGGGDSGSGGGGGGGAEQAPTQAPTGGGGSSSGGGNTSGGGGGLLGDAVLPVTVAVDEVKKLLGL